MLLIFCSAATFSFGKSFQFRLAYSNRKQVGGLPMGLTLKLDVLAVMAAFGFLAAIVFGAF
jgi:hypothetical protein